MKLKDLKRKVQEVYGLPIEYGNQCQELALYITEQTGENISFQTMRRFFGFIDKDKKPSIKTLNILSHFCGYKHYKEFQESSLNTITALENYIIDIFKIEINRPEDLNYQLACKNVAEILSQDLQLLDKHLFFLSHSKVAHEFFWEKFPFIDQLNNPVYRRAIKAYAAGKNTEDAYIYYHALIFLANFLKSGKAKKLPPKLSIKNINKLHPYLQARIVGSNLLAAPGNKKQITRLAFDIADKQTIQDDEKYSYPFFQYMMADYFIYSKMYQEAFDMILHGKYQKNAPLGKLIEKGYYETLDLLYCICLYELNEIELAKESFSSIYTESFHFVFRKSFTIRYLNLKKKLFNKLTKEEENTLAELYSKTGYLYLNI